MAPLNLVIALIISTQPPTSPTATDVGGTVDDTVVRVGVTSVNPTGAPPATASGVADGTAYPVQSLEPACSSNASCATDLDCAGGTPYYVYTQASADAVPVNTLQSVCVHTAATDTTTIPDAVVADATTVWDTTPLSDGTSSVTPTDEVPIGFPLLLRVQGATHVDKVFTLDDVPLHLTATESYTWTLGDGTSLTTASPGIAYDPQRPPDDPDVAGDYVQHSYDQPGPVTVTEQTSWTQVVLTRTDSGVSVPLPGRASGRPQSHDLTVVELRSRLTTP